MGRKLLLVRELLLLNLLLVTALVAGAAPASGARLDPDFGSGGKIALPRSLGEVVGATPLPDGRVLVGLQRRVLCLLPSGEVDTGFGQGGYLAMQPPAGRDGNYSSLTVDQLGRLILAGSSSIPIGAGAAPNQLEDRPAQVFVQRFTSNGQLDLSFGAGNGTVLTDFGLAAAEPGLSPQLGVSSTVVDESGRIVLAGRRAEGIYVDKLNFKRRGSEGFLARLGEDGEIDRPFAGEGVLPLPGTSRVGSMIADREGGVLATVWQGSWGAVIHLDTNGHFDAAFGENGGRAVPRVSGRYSEAMKPLALDSSGQLLLSGKLQGWREKRLANGIAIKLLNADGSLDHDYGHQGLLGFRFPRLIVDRVAAARTGGFLVAMTLRERGNREQAAAPVELAIARLRTDGSLDPGFGRAGTLPIPFPGVADLYLEDITAEADGKALIRVDRCANRCRTILVRIDLRT